MQVYTLLAILPALFQGSLATPVVATTTSSALVCNADNCLRAVRATARISAQILDCSSFAAVTVTPCAVTVTAAATVVSTLPTSVTTTSTTSTTTELTTLVTATTATVYYKRALETPSYLLIDLINKNNLDARAPEPTVCAAVSTFTPFAVPTYASACSGVVRYSSACACLGVTASTTTLVPKTVTVTATSTSSELPLATETVTSISTEQTTTTSTAVSTASLPASTCASINSPNHIETPADSTRCGCTYDVDCSASFAPNTGYLVPYSGATTVEQCRDQCDYYSDCGAYSWNPSTARSCVFFANDGHNPNTLKLDGSSIVGIRISSSTSTCKRASACNTSNYGY